MLRLLKAISSFKNIIHWAKGTALMKLGKHLKISESDYQIEHSPHLSMRDMRSKKKWFIWIYCMIHIPK